MISGFCKSLIVLWAAPWWSISDLPQPPQVYYPAKKPTTHSLANTQYLYIIMHIIIILHTHPEEEVAVVVVVAPGNKSPVGGAVQGVEH